MKPIFTLISFKEAAELMGVKENTLSGYLTPKKNRIPKDWYIKNKLGKYWFKKEKIQGLL